MNKKFLKWGIGSILLSALTGTFLSCSDDHFTINSDVQGRQTLWESINNDEDLSEFADILSRVYYSKSEGNTTSQTYADLLNHAQTFTVWAPKNGTFDYADWKSLLDDGTAASAYKVEKELIRNSMTRFSHLMTGNEKYKVNMFNEKSTIFDCANAKIKDASIINPNIGTSNGVLHITNGAIAFQPNLYEFLKTADGIDSLRAFVMKSEEEVFNEYASTQGPTVDGHITWVDSITYLYNNYTNNYLEAYLNREDSTYAMVIPTNAAWEKAYNDLKRYYVFMPEYQQTVVSLNDEGNEVSETRNKVYTQEELDSVIQFCTKNAITQNLAFNVNEQFGHQIEDFSVPGVCDSLMNTIGNVFYNPDYAALFDGKEPIEMSNGYAYVVDNYNFRPTDTFLSKKRYEAEHTSIANTRSTIKVVSINRERIPYTEDSTIYYVDTLFKTTVLDVVPERPTSNPSATFALRSTLSCKYDIIAVMVPNLEVNRPYQFRVDLTYHKNPAKKTTSTERLKPIEGVNGTGNYFQSKMPHYDDNGNFVICDSILLAQDYELPVCYVGLEEYAYPTLKIESYMTSSDRSKYTNEMLIDKIILVPKEFTDEPAPEAEVVE